MRIDGDTVVDEHLAPLACARAIKEQSCDEDIVNPPRSPMSCTTAVRTMRVRVWASWIVQIVWVLATSRYGCHD